MRTLVTGAAGFIGSHVVDRLLVTGHSVVGLDSFHAFYEPEIKEGNLTSARMHDGFLEVRGDIRDPACLEGLPDDIGAVIHLAALAGVRPSLEAPLEYESVNVHGTLHLLEWMRRRGLNRFVFASSSSTYGEGATAPFREDATPGRPLSPYAASKLGGELHCHVYHRIHGFSVAALRLFTVYGPRQRPDLAIHKFARAVREGRPLTLFGDGSSQRDYTYIDDIVGGILSSLELVRGDTVFEVLNLGSGRMISLAEMVDTLADAMGVRPLLRHGEPQPGDMVLTFADIDKARSLLGYHPATPFPEGIGRFVAWLDSAQPSPHTP